MSNIKEERTKRLDKPILKKIDESVAEKLFNNQGGRSLLDRLKLLCDFEIDDNSENWLIENCKSHNELIYAFQLFLQKAINKGRSKSTLEDFKCIIENIDFSILNSSNNNLIGCVYTLGAIDGKTEEIEIRCCAIPVKKGKGTITCIDSLHINYLPLKRLIKDFNIYIKIYPKIPENHGGWEAALIISIYSSIFNKVMPSSSLVLGGITKEGRIIPIDVETIDALGNKQFTIFISDENENNISTSLINYFRFIYVQHIDEIILSLQQIAETDISSTYKDFLCE